jgi:hypothetical protein
MIDLIDGIPAPGPSIFTKRTLLVNAPFSSGIPKFGRTWRRKVRSEKPWISSRWMEPGRDLSCTELAVWRDLLKLSDESLGFWPMILRAKFGKKLGFARMIIMIYMSLLWSADLCPCRFCFMLFAFSQTYSKTGRCFQALWSLAILSFGCSFKLCFACWFAQSIF